MCDPEEGKREWRFYLDDMIDFAIDAWLLLPDYLHWLWALRGSMVRGTHPTLGVKFRVERWVVWEWWDGSYEVFNLT